jgi:hypothetical protein
MSNSGLSSALSINSWSMKKSQSEESGFKKKESGTGLVFDANHLPSLNLFA